MHNLPNAGGPFGLPALLCMSSELAALKFQLAMVKFKLALERHYAADQPRAPLGTPIGGQWIGPGGYRVDATPSQKPVRVAQSGPGSPLILPEQDPLAADNRIFRIVINPNSRSQIDETDPQVVYTRYEAEQAVTQVRRLEPDWQPRPGLYEDTQGAIADNIGIRQEAEARLLVQASLRMGHNGPPDEADPASLSPGSIDPDTPLPVLRQIVGMPDLDGIRVEKREKGTLAKADIDGQVMFGMNSTAQGYSPEYDGTAAMALRDYLILKYGAAIMKVQNPGQKPNDAVTHAEATVLMRFARAFGGSLKGKRVEIKIDRPLCRSCKDILQLIAKELGNPDVIITEPDGTILEVRNGDWIK